MKKDMPLEGLRWSRDSGSALYDTPPNGRSRTGWGGGKSTDNHNVIVLLLLMWLYTTPQSYDFFLKLPRISGESFEKSILTVGLKRAESPNLSLLPSKGGRIRPL